MNIRPLQFHRNVLTWAERFLTEPLKFTCSEVASGVFWGLKNAGNQLLINYWVSNKYQLRNSEGQGRKSCGGGEKPQCLLPLLCMKPCMTIH